MFSGRFLWLFKINFVTKSNKIEKTSYEPLLSPNNISTENYLNESLFLNFFNIWWNKRGRWSQKFAAGVTKLMSPDEIRSFDGSRYVYACLKGAQACKLHSRFSFYLSKPFWVKYYFIKSLEPTISNFIATLIVSLYVHCSAYSLWLSLLTNCKWTQSAYD